MRTSRFLVVVLVACSGPRDAGHRTTSTQPRAPDAAPSTDAAPPMTGDLWIREAVDYDVYDRRGAIGVAKGAVTILAHGSGSPSALVLTRGATAWSAAMIEPSNATEYMAVDASGGPWLATRKGTAVHIRTPAGAVENVMAGLVQGDRGDIALTFDRSGTAHACIAPMSITASGQVWGGVHHARRGASGWQVEKVTDDKVDACAIAVDRDGTVNIALTEHRETTVWARRPNGWAREVLREASGGSRFVTSATSPTGEIAFAYVHEGAIEVARRDGTGWRRELLGIGGVVTSMLSLALDGKGRAHVAVSGERPDYKVAYVRSGGPAAVIGTRDVGGVIALALDAASDPHIAFVTSIAAGKTELRALIHARLRRPGEEEQPDVRHDETAMVHGCADRIAIKIGRARDQVGPANDRRAETMCHAFAVLQPVALDELGRRCFGGDAKACLVAATMSATDAERKVLSTFEVRTSWQFHDSTFHKFELAKPGQADSARLYDDACTGGIAEACLQRAAIQLRANQLTSSFGLVRACSAALPIACAAAAATGGNVTDLAQVRGELEKACANSASLPSRCPTGREWVCRVEDRPEACNALAYLEESGLGGPAAPAEAAAHHLLACERGSASSCARLLVGPFARPAPPARLDADGFTSRMTERCEAGGEEECLALATAHELGWIVPRDRKAATAVLEAACKHKHAKACARIGRRLP